MAQEGGAAVVPPDGFNGHHWRAGWRRLRPFRRALAAWSAIRPGLFAATAPQALVCRCEGVSRSEIDRAVAAGLAEFRAVKLHSRVAMGLCQGRVCGFAVSHLVARAAGVPVERVGYANSRVPLRPLKMSQLSDPPM